MSLFEEKIYEYLNRFGESFPIFHYMGRTDAQIIEMIQEALDTNTPNVPPRLPPGALC